MHLNTVKFRRLEPDKDMDKLYRIYSDYKEQHNLFSIASLNSPDRFPILFERRISNNYSDFFIIDDLENNFIGFAIAYDYSANDRHLKILLYLDNKYRVGIYCAESIIKFMDMLFKYYSIRKIYTEVYEFNYESVKSNISFGFKEESKLSEYRYYNDQYWDFIIFSMSREDFYDKYGTYVKK